MSQLILKLKGDDFYKGLSLQSAFPIGGMWQLLENYDPFKKLGRLFPTLGPTRKDNAGAGVSIGVPINAFEFYSDGTNRFLLAFGDKTAGNVGAYKINLDTDYITDLVAGGAFANRTGFAEACSMVKYWKGRVIYDERTGGQALRSCTVSGSDDKDVIGSLVGSNQHPSVIGPDGYFYFLNGQYIGRLIISTGTSGNSSTTFDTLDSNLIGRDIDHDGQYIFAGFDNNLNKLSGISADCQIIVWDRFKSYAEKRYTIKDSYIIAVRCLGSACYVLTPSGWYVCSIASEPVLLYPMTSETPFNYFPTDYNQVSKDGHSIYWSSTSAGSKLVFAIGQKIAGKPKIVYNPYDSANIGGVTILQTSLIVSKNYIYTGTNDPAVYKLNDVATKAVAAKSCPQFLPSPYTFSYAKIKLRTALESGDEVSFSLYNSDGEIISGLEAQNFANVGAKKTLIFRRIPSAGVEVNDFTDLYPYILTNVEISEIEIYGDPLPGNHNVQI